MKTLLALIAFSVLLLVPVGAQNAFAGDPNGCSTDSDCDDGDGCNGQETCEPGTGCVDGTPIVCDDGNVCNGLEICIDVFGAGNCIRIPPDGPVCTVGGYIVPVESTPVVLAGAQMSASWMIPVIVSAIGIGIVIARKF